MSKEFEAYLASEGIVRRHSVRNRPQQNGTAERANRTIDEHSTALLHEANMPLSGFQGLGCEHLYPCFKHASICSYPRGQDSS